MGPTEQSAATAQSIPRPWPDRLRVPFVWGVWAVLSVGIVSYVWLVNDNFPIADDFQLVPVYTGHEAVTPAWLWAPYNEHRLPLPKLLLVLGGAATGHDYRAGVLLSALALSALAASMISAAGRLRGGPSYADVFFPLALLHWGQSETLLISYGLNLVVSTVLAGLALLVIVRVREVPSPSQGLFFGLLLLALPLCGSNGVVLVSPLALWLIVAAILRWRKGDAKGRYHAALWFTLALTALALVVVCLLSMQPVEGSPPRSTPEQLIRTAAQFLTASIGPFANSPWSIRGMTWPFSGMVLGALALVTVLRLLKDWRTMPAQRLRTLGLFAFGAALVSLALAVGWGRGAIGPMAGFETRYNTMAAPVLCLAYFVARAAPRPGFAVGLSVLLAALFVFNTLHGIERAEARRARMNELQSDVAADLTSAELAKKWTARIYHPKGEAILTNLFEMLREAHQGPYRGR
jgi:hypothetical protein